MAYPKDPEREKGGNEKYRKLCEEEALWRAGQPWCELCHEYHPPMKLDTRVDHEKKDV